MTINEKSYIKEHYCPKCLENKKIIFNLVEPEFPNQASQSCCIECGEIFPGRWFDIFLTKEMFEQIAKVVSYQIEIGGDSFELLERYSVLWGFTIACKFINLCLLRKGLPPLGCEV